MRILVLIKQVPETEAVRMDEATGTIVRDGVEAIVNPLDLYAVECALRLRETWGGSAETVVLTMGPPKAETALREVLAMGIERAVLVSDRAFAGADTWSTSHVLAAAVRRLQPVDIILCGERATDGDTGQVGPGLAAFLDLPVLTYVSRLDLRAPGLCRAERLVEGGCEQVEAELPAVVTVVKAIVAPRLPTLHGKRRARQASIPCWGQADLEVAQEALGLRGSPTRVERIFRPRVARQGERLSATTPDEIDGAVERIVALIQGKGLT